MAAAAAVCAALALLGPAAAAVAATRPVVELAAPAAADPVLRRALTEDRDWLAAQRPGRLTPVPAAAAPESLRAWLREAAAPAAAADTAAVAPAVAGRRSLLAMLRDRWRARGHLTAQVRLCPAATADVPDTVRVAPGPVFAVGEIAVAGDDFPGRDALLERTLPRPGDRWRPADLTRAVALILQDLGERGHPFPSWTVQAAAVDTGTATVRLSARLLIGPRAVIGPQSSNLAEGRGEPFLLRAAGLRRGELFRESALTAGRERLLARDLYAAVDDPLVHLTTARDTVGIRWLVEPLDRPNRLSVILGLSRQREGQGTRLSGAVDLDLPNLAGTGRQLSAAWSDDGDTRSHFGIAYLEPLILGTPLDVELAVDNEVQQDTYTRFRLDGRVRLPVVALWGIEAGAGWDRTTFPSGDLVRTGRVRGRVALYHRRGDLRRSGWSGLAAIETAYRSATPRTAGADSTTGRLGESTQQRLLEVDLGGELWLSSTASLAGRAAVRQVVADDRPVPLPEQYRYGGARTLRGYREDEFHGETVAYGGAEIRLGRPYRSRVYAFVDLGYFSFARTAPGGGLDEREGTQRGFGLGLLTRAAPGEIDLAVGFPGSVDFETAKLHVSLRGSF